MNKAIFLDKDGTLIPDIPYNIDPKKIILQDNAVPGLKKLQDDGFIFIIISNQSGVARGYFRENNLLAVVSKIQELFIINNLKLDGFYYCPHHPEGTSPGYNIDCSCRKPAPGLLLKAGTDHQINLKDSWMIGDILNDVEAGKRAGCKTVLIDNGNETEWLSGQYRNTDLTCKTINEAAEQILIMDAHELAVL